MHQALDYDIARAVTTAAAAEESVFTSLTTIQRPANTLGPSGQPDLTTFTDVAGMVNIPSVSAPVNAKEAKEIGLIESSSLRKLLLNASYPTIQTSWRALVNGAAWDILSVEADSQSSMTRLWIQAVTL
jgi:hypothetical protein